MLMMYSSSYMAIPIIANIYLKQNALFGHLTEPEITVGISFLAHSQIGAFSTNKNQLMN